MASTISPPVDLRWTQHRCSLTGSKFEFESFGPKEYAALEFLGWRQTIGGYNTMERHPAADHRGRPVRLAGRGPGMQRAVESFGNEQPGVVSAGSVMLTSGHASTADKHVRDRGRTSPTMAAPTTSLSKADLVANCR